MFLLLMLVFTGVHAAVADSVVVDARSNRGSSCSGGSDYVSKNGVIVTSTNATMGQGDVYRFYQGASVTVRLCGRKYHEDSVRESCCRERQIRSR